MRPVATPVLSSFREIGLAETPAYGLRAKLEDEGYNQLEPLTEGGGRNLNISQQPLTLLTRPPHLDDRTYERQKKASCPVVFANPATVAGLGCRRFSFLGSKFSDPQGAPGGSGPLGPGLCGKPTGSRTG